MESFSSRSLCAQLRALAHGAERKVSATKSFPSLPNNARIAVLVTVMFESFSEGKAPPYSPMTTALKPGTRDPLGISWARYGGKTGIWRIMRVLDEFAVRGTVCISGKA